MSNVTVIGAQWGDEGKGKIVDMLSGSADMVVRFQGGHNAGHTVVVNDKILKISILPSGIVRPDVINIIGNGVVLSPEKLFSELADLRSRGVTINDHNIIIADNTPILLPIHALVDATLERDQSSRIGTTKRGISQAYQDKVGRRAVRIVDLSHQASLEAKIDVILAHWNPVLQAHGVAAYSKAALREDLDRYRDDLTKLSSPSVPEMIEAAMEQGANILFEGAQGTMLDIDHGTYPYVTSSNTVSSAVGSGVGLGPKTAGHVLGISKAYTTRVGLGPFPSAMSQDDARHVSDVGREVGTVTGRARSCGWLDLVALKKAIRLNGIDSLALTKIDVLDQLPSIKLVTAYAIDGNTLTHFPNASDRLSCVQPTYQAFDGWNSDTTSVRNFDDLPANAKTYITFIQDHLSIPISIISVGPERDSTIERDKLFSVRTERPATSRRSPDLRAGVK
jgi:adenylosuccinate synthase